MEDLKNKVIQTLEAAGIRAYKLDRFPEVLVFGADPEDCECDERRYSCYSFTVTTGGKLLDTKNGKEVSIEEIQWQAQWSELITYLVIEDWEQWADWDFRIEEKTILAKNYYEPHQTLVIKFLEPYGEVEVEGRRFKEIGLAILHLRKIYYENQPSKTLEECVAYAESQGF